MGCDIHLHAEKLVDGKWTYLAAPAGVDNFADKHGYDPSWYHDRNYDVFAKLAGVRSYFDVKPIDRPRGVPVDVTPETYRDFTLIVDDSKAEESGYCSSKNAARWGGTLAPGVVAHPDWHTASWFTLAELFAVNWGEEQTQDGWVDGETYRQWVTEQKRIGPAYPHCREVGGGGIRKLPECDVDKLIREGKDLTGVYTKISWTESTESACGGFLAAMKRLAKEADDPSHLRIVFWFDN